LEDAISERDAASYTRCFTDSTHGAAAYRFIPAADAQVYASRFLTWSVKDETAYFISLKSQVPAAASMSVFIDSLATETATTDSTVYSAVYTLLAQHTDASKPTQVRGRMHLTIKSDPATLLWSIATWIDIANGTDPSWSILKARF
jgi:hypothetical protein